MPAAPCRKQGQSSGKILQPLLVNISTISWHVRTQWDFPPLLNLFVDFYQWSWKLFISKNISLLKLKSLPNSIYSLVIAGSSRTEKPLIPYIIQMTRMKTTHTPQRPSVVNYRSVQRWGLPPSNGEIRTSGRVRTRIQVIWFQNLHLYSHLLPWGKKITIVTNNHDTGYPLLKNLLS